MIVAGIGCRRNARASAIEAAITAALSACRLERGALDVIATAADKVGEPGINSVADSWGLPLILVDEAAMRSKAGSALTHSARVIALKRVPSVAETAALAAAGPAARLLCARVTNGQAACAIAIGDEPTDAAGVPS